MLNVIDGVNGGMDKGYQEKTTNLQERVTKGGSLPHGLHEGLNIDRSQEFRDNCKSNYKQQQLEKQQREKQVQIGNNKQQKTGKDKEKQQKEKEHNQTHEKFI